MLVTECIDWTKEKGKYFVQYKLKRNGPYKKEEHKQRKLFCQDPFKMMTVFQLDILVVHCLFCRNRRIKIL